MSRVRDASGLKVPMDTLVLAPDSRVAHDAGDIDIDSGHLCRR